jgi:ribonuclease R
MKPKPKSQQNDPRPDEVTREQVIAHLATLSRPASIRAIAHAMGLKHRGRRFLPRVIEQLQRRGEIEEIQAGHYRLAGVRRPKHVSSEPSAAALEPAAYSGATPRSARDPNLVSGRIVAHRDGYGFLVPDKPMPKVEGDLFIGRDNLNDAMHGDRVLARIERRRADGRAEGRVVQILEREHPTLIGLFRYGPHGNHVLPYDTRILHEVLIPPGHELTPDLREKLGGGELPAASRRLRLPELDGAVVNVEISRYPKGGLAPAGRVVEILGRPGEIGVDVEIIIRKHTRTF